MKTIIINESQKNMLFESQGVPDKYIEVAKQMTMHVIDEHLYDLYDSYEDDDEIDFWDDSDDGYIEDSIVINGEYYHYELYNMGNYNKKAETDGDTITINYEPIKNILRRIDKNFEESDYYVKEAYIERTVYDYLYPVLLHEFTHNTNYDEVETQGTFVSAHRLNFDDIKEILYLFSENELNSRISSAYAIMETTLNELLMGGEFDSGQEFYDFVDEWVFIEKELAINMMDTYISLIRQDFQFSDKKYIKRCKEEGHKPYSLPYYLFKNDTRLRNNRKLKQLFDDNFISASNIVVNFYSKLLNNYKSKIIRSCWKAYQDYLQNREKQENSQ